jgi:hypothetical protein
MAEAPTFFVPSATPENQEAAYAQLAARCGVVPPRGADRVYSIVFENHGEEWTATVGESLRGVRTRSVQRKKRVEHLRDRAVVLAIFPGVSYRVVTTHGAAHGSAFHNPIEAGPPVSIKKFASTEGE